MTTQGGNRASVFGDCGSVEKVTLVCSLVPARCGLFPVIPAKKTGRGQTFQTVLFSFVQRISQKKLKNSMQTPNGGNHMTRTVRKRSVVRGKTKVNTLLFQFRRRRSSPSGAGGLKLSVTFSRANSHIDL